MGAEASGYYRSGNTSQKGMNLVRDIQSNREKFLIIMRRGGQSSPYLEQAAKIFDTKHELNCVIGTSCATGRWIAQDFLFKNLLLPINSGRISYVVFRPGDIAGDEQALNFLSCCEDPVYGICLVLMRSGYLFACADEVGASGAGAEYTEMQPYLNYLLQEYWLSEEYANMLLNYLRVASPETLNEAREKLENMRKRHPFLGKRRNIMIVAPDFNVGGGQMLTIRIANFLSVYHNVFLCNTRPELVEQNMVNMISRGVTVYKYPGDVRDFNDFLLENQIEIINSHIWWSDTLVYFAQKQRRIGRWILCMHGCYEALLDNPELDPKFAHIAQDLLDMPAHIVYATDKNKEVFERYPIRAAERRLHKIHYGYQRQAIPTATRASLDIDEESIIFGMVARSIPEKGWQQAIDATLMLHETQKCDLILVASGSYIDDLQQKYAGYSFIHFVPGNEYQSQWISYVKLFDICLLPTYFISETLPNTIIEYLAYDKPVIATEIGDIPQMLLGSHGEDAGLLLTLNDNTVEPVQLYEKMRLLAQDTDLRQRLANNARTQFAQYDMNEFISNYFSLFVEPENQEKGKSHSMENKDKEIVSHLLARIDTGSSGLKVEDLYASNLSIQDGQLHGENNDPHFSIRFNHSVSQITFSLKGSSSIPTNKIKLYFGNDYDYSEERAFNIGNFKEDQSTKACHFGQDINTIRIDLGDYDASYKIISISLKQEQLMTKEGGKLVRRLKKLWQIFRLACQNKTLRKRGIEKIREVGLKRMLLTAAELLERKGSMEVTYSGDRRNKDKIVVCIHDMEQAGAQALTLRIIKSLREDYGYEIALITLKSGKFKDEFSKYATLYNLNQATIIGIDHLQQLREIVWRLQNEGYSKAICNSASTGALCGALSDLGMHCISMVHELPTSLAQYCMEESASELARTAHSIIFASQFVKDKFCTMYPLQEERLKIIPQCIVKPVRIDKKEAKQKLKELIGLDPDKKLIMGCGHADIRKGIELFCQTAIQYYNRYDMEVQFIWVGVVDEKLYLWMMDDLKKAGIEKNVFLLNRFINDPSTYFAGADMFLLTSREDPFPTVVLDAMYHGTPTIAFRGAGGTDDLLRDEMGFLVDYLDVSQMADTLNACLVDEQTYQSLSAKLSDHAERNYNTKDYVKALLYELGEAKGYNQRVTQAYQVTIREQLLPNRKKVLHIIENFVTGGSSQLVVDIYERLGHKYEQHVIANRINNPIDYEGIPYTVFPLSAKREEVLRQINGLEPDIIHIQYWGSIWYEWMMDILKDVKGCKIIENVNIPIKPYTAPFIDKYVYVSDYVLKSFVEDKERSTFVYPGSDFTFFTRKLTDGYLKKNTIGMVYRLDSDKLTDDSIDVFIRTVQKRPQTKALIVGGGNRFEQYYKKVEQAGVMDSFIFTGYVPYNELPSYYAQMSIFVAPVWRESFGQVSPFAMSMGLPVCGYNIGALHEIIGDVSLLAKFEEIEELSDILIKLLDDPQRCEEIGRANQLRAKERFDLPTMIQKYDMLYDEMLSTGVK